MWRRARKPTPAAPDLAAERERLDNEHVELLLGFLLRDDGKCIDVGANQGRFLWQMTRRAPRGRHLAWEPLPHLAAKLRESFPQVEVHEAALAESPGEAEFVYVIDDPGYSGLRERAHPESWRTERITVAVERLDDQLDADYAPTLIKADVEGAELGLFRGARETIARHRPWIVFEHGPGAADVYGTTPEEIHDLLCGELGMDLFDLDATGPLSRDQLAELFATGARWNYVARPPRERVALSPPANALDAAERRRRSQNGEDGVIEAILRQIGAPTRFFVEFGAEDGREGNCAALAEDGWAGLLIEADAAKYAALAERWRDRPDVRTRNDRLSPETIEDVFRAEEVPPEPAVVSIDVDSIDWYLWEALESFRPRLVVIEYNASLPLGRKLVQPRELAGEWDGTDFYGASVAALEALAERKGYALVHTERHGVNAFFVRSDLIGDLPTGARALRRPANHFGSGAGHPRDPQNRPWVDLDAGGELVRLDQRASAVVESE